MKYAYSLLELVIHSIYHYVEYIISIFNTKLILFLLSVARENVITYKPTQHLRSTTTNGFCEMSS